MMLQVVASPTIVILTTLEVSFMLLDNIYTTGVTYDCQNIVTVPPQLKEYQVFLG
jgi:hypothetical protein